jgi:hypothetical protein
MPKTPPKLTAKEREAALAAAAKARKARAHMKEQLASGGFTLADVFHLADEGSKAVTKTKVKAVLTALPKVGNVTAKAVMEELRIPANRNVGGLGVRQRAALIDRFA